jgi:hypothetical protein
MGLPDKTWENLDLWLEFAPWLPMAAGAFVFLAFRPTGLFYLLQIGNFLSLPARVMIIDSVKFPISLESHLVACTHIFNQ